MSWPLSTMVALLSGVLGLVAGGLVMNACVRWYRISGFEGGSGYAVVAVALLGGVAGAILGFVVARMLTGEGGPGFLKALGVAWALVLAIAGLAAVIAWALADIPPRIGGRELMLEVELMLPVDVKASPARGSGESFLGLASVANHVQRNVVRGELRPADARLQGGRWVVPGSVHVDTSRGLRALDIQLNGEPVQGFLVPLPARPGREFLEWSEWGPRPPASQPPWPDSKPSFRFRVSPIEPPPPGPTPEELAAEEVEAEQARFDAMDPGATVADWLPWTRYGASEEHQAGAITQMMSRGSFVAEMTALITSPDTDVAAEALRLIPRLPAPPDSLVPPVAAVGRDLAVRLHRVNGTSAEADPGYGGAADVASRFSSWMEAVRTLRESCGGDFTPELLEILKLSRERPDSMSIRGSVLRVASYWMSEWTGLAPLPGDPPPR